MGRRLKTQRRGKGSPMYRVRRKGIKVKYPFNYTLEKLSGEIINIINTPINSAPLAEIKLEDDSIFYTPASEGAYVGQRIEVGSKASLDLNNVLPLDKVPAGHVVYNLESKPGNGGSFFRASGTFGLIIGKDQKGVYIKMKSGEKKLFDPKSLCTLGLVAGSGKKEKPHYKAGNKYHLRKARSGKLYPVVRGYAMNTVDHPHGGSGHNSAGRQKQTSKKFGAPGQKVGHFGAKKTGRRKK